MIYIYTDGACSGNPGKGGFGAVIIYPEGKRVELSQGYKHTTNNRMELLSVITALESLNNVSEPVTITSDSKYVTEAINQKWLEGWIKKNFAKVKNPDLWQRFVPLYRTYSPTFIWIKGHAGHKENERCDKLGVAAYHSDNLIDDVGYQSA